jgi:hypothetical protein
MKPSMRLAAVAFSMLCLAGASRAAEDRLASPAHAVPEPAVQHTVIEDDGSRIEELRVRGQTQRISVKPKVGPRKGYEILTGSGLTQPPEGGGNDLQGARGKRVWNVLSF